jgi:hypothetical protein
MITKKTIERKPKAKIMKCLILSFLHKKNVIKKGAIKIPVQGKKNTAIQSHIPISRYFFFKFDLLFKLKILLKARSINILEIIMSELVTESGNKKMNRQK